MSQTALGEKAGVGQQLISQIENGHNATTKKLPEIARALGCKVRDLDPNYSDTTTVEDSPLIQKLNRIVGANNEEQLRRLDEYLDFLLAREAQSHDDKQ